MECLKCILSFLNANDGALMVIITLVYAVTTVFILRANNKSADATREQLTESKRQYEDKKRLEIMPYIQFEQTDGLADYVLNLALDSGDNLTGKYILLTSMKNIGNGTAKNIEYTYQWDNCTKSCDKGAFPVQALSSGDGQKIKLDFSHSTNDCDERSACFLLRYKDLLENTYTQQLSIKFKRNASATQKLTEYSTSSPVFLPKEDAHA